MEMTAKSITRCAACGHDVNEHAHARGACTATRYNPSTHEADKCGCGAVRLPTVNVPPIEQPHPKAIPAQPATIVETTLTAAPSPRPNDDEIAAWVVHTVRLFGGSTATAHKVAAMFVEALNNDGKVSR